MSPISIPGIPRPLVVSLGPGAYPQPEDGAFEIVPATEAEALSACHLQQAHCLVVPAEALTAELGNVARNTGIPVIGIGSCDPFSVRSFYQAGGGEYLFEQEATPANLFRTIRFKLGEVQARLPYHLDPTFWTSITDLAPDLLYLYDLDSERPLWLNRAVEPLLGLTRDEMKRLEPEVLANLIHADDREAFEAGLLRLRTLRPQEFVKFEYRVRHRNGSWRWLLSTNAAFRTDELGKVTQVIGATQDVTELRKAEQALAQKELDASTILSSITDGFFIIDRDWHFSFLNQAAEIILNRPRGELLGRNLWHEFPGLPGTPFAVAYRDAMDGKSSRLVAFYPDHGRYYQASFYPYADGLSVFFRDVTLEHKFEETVRENEELFRRASDAGGAMVYDTDLTEARRPVAHGLEAVTGVSLGSGELSNEWWLSRVHPEDRERLFQPERDNGQSHSKALYRLQHADGSWRHVEDRAEIFRDASGKPVRLIGTVVDVTDQILAIETLRESQTRLNLSLEASGIGIFEWIMAADRVLWSAEMYEIFGASVDDFDETAEDFLGRIHPDDSERVKALAREAFANKARCECFFRIITGDQRVRWVHAASRVVMDTKNQAPTLLGTIRDVSDQKHTEEGLRSANEVLSNFAVAAAHDLREPLRTVMTCSEILSEEFGNRTQDPIRFQVINQMLTGGVQRMDHLLHDLLEYIKASEEPAELGLVDCNHVLRRVVENCQLSIEEACAEVFTEAELPTIPGREMELVSVFQNLIGNALKYRSQAPPRIHISAVREPGHWMFAVQDNGEGIAEEYRQMIFGMFKRLHARNVAGTGIGLAICEKIVTKYGGRIWVDGGPGGVGSIFRFTWPVAREGPNRHGGSAAPQD